MPLRDHFRRQRLKTIGQSELGVHEEDRMMNVLQLIIRGAVRMLAVLMAKGGVILALGLVYWLMDRKTVPDARHQRP